LAVKEKLYGLADAGLGPLNMKLQTMWHGILPVETRGKAFPALGSGALLFS
jgi:hypothetical protein